MDDNNIKCPKCGHENASSSEECDNCGVTLSLVLGDTKKPKKQPKPPPHPPNPPKQEESGDIKNCPKCGEHVAGSSTECIKCGIIFSKYFEVKERKLRETLSDLDRSVLAETSDGEVNQETAAEKEKVQAELEKAEAERRKIEEQEKSEAERHKAEEEEKARKAAEEAKRLKKQQEEAAKAKAEAEAKKKERAEKEAAEKEKAAEEPLAPAMEKPADPMPTQPADKEHLQRIAQLEKETETLRLQTVALQKEKLDFEKAEIVKKEQLEQERQEVLQKAQEAQERIAALEKETQALHGETETLKKDKADLEAEVARRKEQDDIEAEQRRQAEKEEQEKAEALEKERQDAKKRTETILKAVLPKPTMKELLKKYEGEAVGINFDDPAEIKKAILASVNEDHFSIMVPENELVHSYPYSHVVSIVEGAEGVPIDASGETPTYQAVIRVYHLNVKKKWGFI